MHVRRIFVSVAAAALSALSLAAAGNAASGAAPTAPTAAASNVSMTMDAQLGGAIFAATNAIRAQHGLPRLRSSHSLSAAAAEHSRDMAVRGYFAHSSANGTEFWQRIRHHYGQHGYRHWMVGENLLWSSPNVDATRAMQMWMASPAHRDNILDRRWRKIGLSAVRVPVAPGAFRGLEVTIVTADFGARA
jgi:uncharacterized protein YkwD